jgi:hypothetical protein
MSTPISRGVIGSPNLQRLKTVSGLDASPVIETSLVTTVRRSFPSACMLQRGRQSCQSRQSPSLHLQPSSLIYGCKCLSRIRARGDINDLKVDLVTLVPAFFSITDVVLPGLNSPSKLQCSPARLRRADWTSGFEPRPSASSPQDEMGAEPPLAEAPALWASIDHQHQPLPRCRAPAVSDRSRRVPLVNGGRLECRSMKSCGPLKDTDDRDQYTPA